MSDKKDKDKKNNILNFVNKSKENKKIQTEDDEFKRMDALAKELVDVYYKASKQILENDEEWIKEYKDWDGASINDKIEGANKPQDENETIH